MISTKLFILIAIVISNIYDVISWRVADGQRKKPLPDEVADIYDSERYQKYLEYTADNKRLSFKYKVIEGVTDLILIFSPIYSAIEKMCHSNPYLITLVTLLIVDIVAGISHWFSEYERTFTVEEKYGFNKKDLKEFVKDFMLEQLLSFVLMIVILEFITFVIENLFKWTNGFEVSVANSIIITTAMVGAFFIIIVLMQRLSYVMLKKQYVFTPLEDGPLRDKILAFQEGAKKKTDKIYIYNESKKSTSKNAFLLKIIGRREFGIADNFMNENDEKELLAVLSHEVGHLKHKKNLLNYLSYSVYVVLYIIIIFSLINPGIFQMLAAWIRSSFSIEVNNYYLLVVTVTWITKPVLWVYSIFNNYRSRCEEREADREAVKNGYGNELIATFKQMSTDELINVNPHPFIEFTEYSHPGMYQRIKAINEAIIDKG